MMTILESLEKGVLSEISFDHGKKSLGPEENLLEQGIIDSLGVMKLITFMEKTFGIQVLDEDVVPENFQSLTIMARFVEQKMQNKQSA
jgi:acyl carrier protein